jgi:hypothetical protein
MAFPAEPMTLGEVDQLPVKETEFVAIFSVVAIQAPAHAFCMVHDDLGMFFFKLPLLSVDLHGGMALTAGEDAFGKRRRRDWKLLVCPPGRNG